MSSGQSKQALAPLASTDLLEPIFPLYSHCSQARCSAGTARERGCHTSPRIGHRQWKQGIRPHKAAADRLETDLKQCWNPNITCMAPAFACVGCWRIPRLFIKCPCYSRSRESLDSQLLLHAMISEMMFFSFRPRLDLQLHPLTTGWSRLHSIY